MTKCCLCLKDLPDIREHVGLSYCLECSNKRHSTESDLVGTLTRHNKVLAAQLLLAQSALKTVLTYYLPAECRRLIHRTDKEIKELGNAEIN